MGVKNVLRATSNIDYIIYEIIFMVFLLIKIVQRKGGRRSKRKQYT